MEKKNFALKTKVRFVNTGVDSLENQTGTILGKSMEYVFDTYIVLLDNPLDNHLAVTLTEHCLEDVNVELSDTVKTEKTLLRHELIAQSLVNLRDELWEKKNPALDEVFWKINSCLYRGYQLDKKVDV